MIVSLKKLSPNFKLKLGLYFFLFWKSQSQIKSNVKVAYREIYDNIDVTSKICLQKTKTRRVCKMLSKGDNIFDKMLRQEKR